MTLVTSSSSASERAKDSSAGTPPSWQNSATKGCRRSSSSRRLRRRITRRASSSPIAPTSIGCGQERDVVTLRQLAGVPADVGDDAVDESAWRGGGIAQESQQAIFAIQVFGGVHRLGDAVRVEQQGLAGQKHARRVFVGGVLENS